MISGEAGVALLIDSDGLKALNIEEPEAIVPWSASKARVFLGHVEDARTLENVEITDVVRELDRDSRREEALHLVLICLNPGLCDPLRTNAARVLADLMRE